MFILILPTLITNFVSFEVEAEEMVEMLTVRADSEELIIILIPQNLYLGQHHAPPQLLGAGFSF